MYYVTHIHSNIKGGVNVNLGEKTLLVGPNGQGKSAIVNAVELALGGSASDIVGRAEVKREADLLALTDDERVHAAALLSNGQSCVWEAQSNGKGGAKRATHECPVPATFPVREVRAALGGSNETVRSWLLSHVVSDLSREDVIAWFTEEEASTYERLASAQDGPEIDTLLSVLSRAGKESRSKKRDVKAARALLDKLGSGLDPEPTSADLDKGKQDASDALSGYESALRASGKAAALQGVGDLKLEAERLVSVFERTRVEYEQAGASAPAGTTLDDLELEATVSGRLGHLCRAHAVHQDVGSTDCLVCGSKGPFDHYALEAQKEETNAALATRAGWWEAHQRLGGEAKAAEAAAVQAVQSFQDAQESALGIKESGVSVGEAKAEWERLHIRQVALEAASSQWAGLRGQKDEIRQLQADTADLGALLEAGQQAVNRLLKTAVVRFEKRVQAHLPPTDVFALVLEEDGREVCRFGFRRDSALHTALSGAEWARLTLAMACAVSDGSVALRVFTPEERAFDPATLREVMAALSDAPGQVLLTSPIKHKGRLPRGWTVVDLTEAIVSDSTQSDVVASPA